jgi:hypothetical protein
MNKLLLILLTGTAPLQAGSFLAKILNTGKTHNSSSVVFKMLNFASQATSELKELILHGRSVRATNLLYKNQFDPQTSEKTITVDYSLRKTNRSHSALYTVSLTASVQTGEIKTQFSEKSLRPGVEVVPPLSEDEKREILDEIMPYLNGVSGTFNPIKARKRMSPAPEKLL